MALAEQTKAQHQKSSEITGCFPWFKYRTAAPNAFLIKTGFGIRDVHVCKSTIHWPCQRLIVVDMSPRNYEFKLNNMSAEMVPFILPVVYTIGPVDPKLDEQGFMTFVRRMSGLPPAEVASVVAGVVHGQTRVFSAGMTIREMFADRDMFKNNVQERVQKDLLQYGLKIYNANIAEMKDLDDNNKYFENLKQKALEGASTEARIQVAEARKTGDIQTAIRKGETSKQVAGISASVTETENARAAEVAKSNMELQLVRTACKQQEDVAKVKADFVTRQQAIALQTEYETLSQTQQVEHLRSTELSKATVLAETRAKAAYGEAQAMRTRADAELYEATKKAEAVQVLRQAQAVGLKTIFEAAGTDRPELVMFYLSLENGLYDRMAAQTANAIQGLNPKINIWSTGPAGENDAMASMRSLFTGLPPMLDALHQQTNLKMPSWMPSIDVTKGAAASAMAAVPSTPSVLPSTAPAIKA